LFIEYWITALSRLLDDPWDSIRFTQQLLEHRNNLRCNDGLRNNNFVRTRIFCLKTSGSEVASSNYLRCSIQMSCESCDLQSRLFIRDRNYYQSRANYFRLLENQWITRIADDHPYIRILAPLHGVRIHLDHTGLDMLMSRFVDRGATGDAEADDD